MYRQVKSIANNTDKLILVVFGDVDWRASANHRHIMVIAPGGFYLLSLNDTKNYRGEWHIFTCDEATKVGGAIAKGKHRCFVSLLDAEGRLIVSEGEWLQEILS